MDRNMLQAKAVKRIALIILAGLAVLIIDLVASGNESTLELMQDKKGVFMTRPAAGQEAGHVRLRAEVKDRDFDKTFDLVIDSRESTDESDKGSDISDGSMSEGELAAYEIRSAVNSVNDDTVLRRIYLPDSLSTGEEIRWTVERKSNTALILLIIGLLAVFTYRNRFSPLKKQLAAEQDSIARQLPEFVNRLVLLLNAGMVLNSAFEKSVTSDEKDYFFTQMNGILDRVHQTNVPMNREFSEFARSRRCMGGDVSRQLMRISNIINDNISKGVELTEKLQRESEILWLARKRNCEERGKIAETKLTLPLTIFLLVLIVITVSPALLEL